MPAPPVPPASPRPHCGWDRLPLPYTTINESYLRPGESVESLRAERRVQPYERYLELLGMTIDEDRRRIELDALARETDERLCHWLASGVRIPARGWRSARAFRTERVAVEIGVTMMIIAAVVLPAFMTAAWGALLTRAGVAVGLCLAAATLITLRSGRAAARDVLTRKLCPDCGYRLDNLRPAIDPADLGGRWVGPRACPECGGPWPMIPPPVLAG